MQKHLLKGETGDAPFKRAQGPPIRADHLDAFQDLWTFVLENSAEGAFNRYQSVRAWPEDFVVQLLRSSRPL
jgi:hypothetical protein